MEIFCTTSKTLGNRLVMAVSFEISCWHNDMFNVKTLEPKINIFSAIKMFINFERFSIRFMPWLDWWRWFTRTSVRAVSVIINQEALIHEFNQVSVLGFNWKSDGENVTAILPFINRKRDKNFTNFQFPFKMPSIDLKFAFVLFNILLQKIGNSIESKWLIWHERQASGGWSRFNEILCSLRHFTLHWFRPWTILSLLP